MLPGVKVNVALYSARTRMYHPREWLGGMYVRAYITLMYANAPFNHSVIVAYTSLACVHLCVRVELYRTNHMQLLYP